MPRKAFVIVTPNKRAGVLPLPLFRRLAADCQWTPSQWAPRPL
jgi:hypothetical protein